MPKAEWQWVYDKPQGKLSVMDRDRSFPIVYHANMLRLRDSQVLDFTVEDVTRYIELFESSALQHFEESLRCKIILHRLAIDLFHKPIMPKSWIFQTAMQCQTHFSNADIAMLTTCEGGHVAKYMILEQQDNFCLCMLFDQSHSLPNNKIFEQFQLIKVTTDKLTPCLQAQAHEWVSFQNAG